MDRRPHCCLAQIQLQQPSIPPRESRAALSGLHGYLVQLTHRCQTQTPTLPRPAFLQLGHAYRQVPTSQEQPLPTYLV